VRYPKKKKKKKESVIVGCESEIGNELTAETKINIGL
jgi:hypothetical protein